VETLKGIPRVHEVEDIMKREDSVWKKLNYSLMNKDKKLKAREEKVQELKKKKGEAMRQKQVSISSPSIKIKITKIIKIVTTMGAREGVTRSCFIAILLYDRYYCFLYPFSRNGHY